jgi:6,7-dimethyl-8-ribityllumazine synthase
MASYQGKVRFTGAKRIACLFSRFNEEITARLLKGALEAFKEAAIPASKTDIFSVPGAFEIPTALQKILAGKRYQGVVVLSCIVKGGTDHDQYVAKALTDGIARLSLKFQTPVAYGVITARTWNQALERSGGRHGNRGKDAARTCLEMIDLLKRMPQ